MRKTRFVLTAAFAISACADPGADSGANPNPGAGTDSLRPAVIQWNASAAELEQALDGKCANGFKNRLVNPPFLPEVEDSQIQIDCDGFQFLGAPRWTEFLIGDDRLQMVWIMVDASDQDAAVAALEAAYGTQTAKNDLFIAFAEDDAAWRFEPPEVLFYAPELAGWVEPWFETGDH